MGRNLAALISVNSLISVGYEILNSKSHCDVLQFTLQAAAWFTDLGLNHPMALEPHLPHNLTHVNLRKQMQVGVEHVMSNSKRKPAHASFNLMIRNKICFSKTKWISNNLQITILAICILNLQSLGIYYGQVFWNAMILLA